MQAGSDSGKASTSTSGPSAPSDDSGAGQAVTAARPLTGHSIIVDPGHGRDPQGGGYTGDHGVNGAWEDANVLDVANRLSALLRSEGAGVYQTRGAYDPGPPPHEGLARRVAFAEAHHGQVYVSIHEDDSSDPAVHGVWTYYWHPDSRRLARDIEAALLRVTGLSDKGTPTAPFYVIRNTTMPSVLVEGGFLSNPAEARLITTPGFHQKEAQAIDDGLLTYFGAR